VRSAKWPIVGLRNLPFSASGFGRVATAHVQGASLKVVAHGLQRTCYEHPACPVAPLKDDGYKGGAAMVDIGDGQPVELTEEAQVVVALTQALYAKQIDEVFRILGRHLDKYKLQVSYEVMEEYHIAKRIKSNT